MATARNRVIWVLNAACPSRCLYCDIESQRDTHALDVDEVRRAATQVLEAGFREVVFVGGEPLLSPALPGALEVLRGRATVALFTGGIPGDPERLVDVVAQGIDRLVLSIDAGPDRANDLMRGRAGTTRDLYAFAEAVRRRLGAIDISVNTVVSRHNADALPEIWDRIRPLAPTAWALTLAGDNFRGAPAEHFLERAQVERFFLEVVPALAAAVDRQLIVLPVPLPFLEAGTPPRRWGVEGARHRDRLALEFDDYARGDYNAAFVTRHGCPLVGIDVTIGVGGEVHPCSQAPIIQPRYVVGDLRRAHLADVLAGEALVRFRDAVPEPPCRRYWAPSNVPTELLRRVVA